MTKNRFFGKAALTAVALGLCLCVNPHRLLAQGSFAGIEYFNPAYAYRHNLNPALVPQWGYVGFPGAGNLNVTLSSNMGLGSVLFPVQNADGKKVLGTFMHPDVSADDFLNQLHKKNDFRLNLQENLFSAGWFWGRSFWNFGISVKADADVNLPLEMLAFMKKGMYSSTSRYSVENLGIHFRGYIEASIGYARELNEQWTVGGRFKLLLGLAEADLNIRKMDILLSDQAWEIASQADLHVYGRLLNLDFKDDGFMPGFGIGTVALSGAGVAFDLGMEYRPDFAKGLRFSASVTDLGFINYTSGNISNYEAVGGVRFEGFRDLDLNLGLGDEIEVLVEDAKKMIKFAPVEVEPSAFRGISPVLNFAVEYGLWGNRFSVGLINTTIFYRSRPESDLTLVGNIHPCRWFSMALSYSFFHANRGMGWCLNFTPKWGLNLFIASNYTPLYVNNYFIPIKDARMNLQVGVTVPLGNNRRCTYAAEEFDVNYYPYTFRDDDAHPGRFEGARRSKPDDAEDEDYWEEIEREKREREALMNGTDIPAQPAAGPVEDAASEDGEDGESDGKVKPVLEYEFEEAEPAGETPETPVETTITIEPEDQSVILLDPETGEPLEQNSGEEPEE